MTAPNVRTYERAVCGVLAAVKRSSSCRVWPATKMEEMDAHSSARLQQLASMKDADILTEDAFAHLKAAHLKAALKRSVPIASPVVGHPVVGVADVSSSLCDAGDQHEVQTCGPCHHATVETPSSLSQVRAAPCLLLTSLLSALTLAASSLTHAGRRW